MLNTGFVSSVVSVFCLFVWCGTVQLPELLLRKELFCPQSISLCGFDQGSFDEHKVKNATSMHEIEDGLLRYVMVELRHALSHVIC